MQLLLLFIVCVQLDDFVSSRDFCGFVVVVVVVVVAPSIADYIKCDSS